MAFKTVQSYQPNKDKEIKPRKKKISFKEFVLRYRLSIIIIFLAIIAAITLIVLLNKIPLSQSKDFPKITKTKPKIYYTSLSGLPVNSEDEVNRPVTAIMIPNDSYGARPQSGIAKAELVFEAIAEGGITRFMAFYQTNQPNLVGPIRSVRPYYLHWAAPLQASIVQTGGSARAYQIMRNDGYRDIGFDNNSKYYWRDKSRKAPNNVYTNFEKINQLNQTKGYTSSSVDMFARQDGRPVQTPNATQVSVKISRSAVYNSHYTYDSTDNKYTRHQNGQIHNDPESGPIKTDAVIAINVVERKVFEDGYREDIEVVGQGQAHIFQNGQVIEATWKKPSITSQIRFYSSSNEEIAINRGIVWISAIPSGVGAVSWQ